MPSLPTGTVTFLFTDIEGSTALLQHLGDRRYGEVLAEHHRLARNAFQEAGGQEIGTEGDAFLIAFQHVQDAVTAAVGAQRAIATHPWPEGISVRVRMGLHTGTPIPTASGYVGLDVHRAARIMSAGYGGQILLSQGTRDLLEPDLPGRVTLQDLGEHRLKDLTRPEHIFQVIVPGLPADFPPLKALDMISHNLPVQLTSFIGREREIEDVKSLLARTRLLTLTGTGGAGKTRLAIQAAADLIEQFQHGVWLVELAPLTDPAVVTQTVASTFAVREAAGRPLLDSLTDYLRTKSLLLVLDNCEHLVATCAHLASALLRACPKLQIMATSREILGVAGEVIYRIPPLSHPDPRRLHALDQLIQFEGIRLFVERAVHSQPRFVLTDANAKAVAHICQQLDGIPLAIELAAARVKMLPVEQIAARLDDRFRLLTHGSRTALPHHQTLRATMDWSYDLLSDPERALLRRLSVFAGSFILEATEAICAGDGVEAYDVLDLLTNFIDKSLVVAEGLDEEVRYQLLETIRQYGQEKLRESGEVAVVHERHLAWYLDLAERAEPELQGPNQETWLQQLEKEHDNLRTALEWSKVKDGGTEAGVRLAGALHWFWAMRGYLSEGREWLEALVARNDSTSTAARTKAVYGAGRLAFDQGDYGRAEALCQESLSQYRELGDKLGMALSLNTLGILARNRGDYGRAISLLDESLTLCRELGHKWALGETLNILGLTVRRQDDFERARALSEESLALFREIGDKWGLARSLGQLGVVARYQGDYERARALHEESLALRKELGHKFDLPSALISLGMVALAQADWERAKPLFEESLASCRDLGDKLGIAASLGNLGIVACHQGDHDRARALLEESKTLWQALGAKQGIAGSLNYLGMVARSQGDYEQAATLYRESLLMYRNLEDKFGIAECLVGLAALATATKQAERAARLFGAAEALREAIKTPTPRSERAAYDQSVATLRALLGEEAFAAARAQGRSMPLEEAMAEAIKDGGVARKSERSSDR